MAATSDDLPALGKPTRPTSATTFSSRVTTRASPSSPRSAKPGAFRLFEASAALPRPPRPPAATTSSASAPVRSASSSPVSASLTTVPSGTASTTSSPLPPLAWSPRPGWPLVARRCDSRWYSTSVVRLGSTRRITEPPSPPLPPSGPPSGLNFSRWTDAQPWPPLPPYVCRVTRSTKLGIAIGESPSPGVESSTDRKCDEGGPVRDHPHQLSWYGPGLTQPRPAPR